MVVAHNPGSFYPAKKFAKRNKIPYGIDLEDYHPGETTDTIASDRFKKLNAAILPEAAYVSAASPLIMDYSKAHIKAPFKKGFLLLNYFSQREFRQPSPLPGEKLQLVWFSQNISWGRGLEEMIPVVKNNDACVLHLYGNADSSFCDEWIKGIPNIVLHEALPQQELHKELYLYDIGLALEKPASNLNRDLCITNKILAYYQAGLYILASSTSAQDDFIKSNPAAGKICILDTASLSIALQGLIATQQSIRSSAINRFATAGQQNWERESEKLLNNWKQVLS